jgi:hypothetical protein
MLRRYRGLTSIEGSNPSFSAQPGQKCLVDPTKRAPRRRPFVYSGHLTFAQVWSLYWGLRGVWRELRGRSGGSAPRLGRRETGYNPLVPSTTTPPIAWKRNFGLFVRGGLTAVISLLVGTYLSRAIFGVDWLRHSTGFLSFVETTACGAVAYVLLMAFWFLLLTGYRRLSSESRHG